MPAHQHGGWAFLMELDSKEKELKMNITYKKLSEITPYEKNPRRNDEAVEAVAESIKQFGFKVPLVIDKDGIIVTGHTRYKAAQKLGLKSIPCIVADDLNEAQIKAYRLADNKVAEIAEWDEDLLWQELQELADMNMAMDVFGFDEFDVEEDDVEAEEDFYEPELPTQPRAKKGDIYQLGEHRLMCGDCTDENDVDELLDGAEMDLCVTDPPYNVDYGSKVEMLGGHTSESRDTSHILNDHMDNQGFYHFLNDFYTQMLRSLKAGGAFYIWHAETEGANFRIALEDAGGKVRQTLIWVKPHFVMSRQDYHWRHEPCLYGWKDGAAHYFIDDRRQSTVFEDKVDIDNMNKEEMKNLLKEIFEEDKVSTTILNEAKPTVNDLHPTMKPIKLIARLIKNSSKKNERVIDFFGGSGSTLIAAEQLGRKCYMMELDPKYVDVIIDRWETLTGEKAKLIKQGN